MAAAAFGEGRLPRSSGLEAYSAEVDLATTAGSPSHKKPLCKDDPYIFLFGTKWFGKGKVKRGSGEDLVKDLEND